MGIATLYGIRNCDTVKKARAWLQAHGVPYQFHDYKTSGIDEDRLARWCGELGWEVLLNRAVLDVERRLVVGFKPDLYKALGWE